MQYFIFLPHFFKLWSLILELKVQRALSEAYLLHQTDGTYNFTYNDIISECWIT